jgi:hypothetical protein
MPYGAMPDARLHNRLREAFLSYGAPSSFEMAASDRHRWQMKSKDVTHRVPVRRAVRRAHARG